MKNEGIQIRISDIVHVLYRHRLLIVALTLGGLLIGIALSGVSYLRGDVSREYAVSGTIAISPRVGNGNYSSNNTYPNNNDFHLAEDMVTASIFVLNSEKTLDTVINSLRILDVTASDLKNNLTLSQYEATQIIEMTLYWRSAEEGIAILETLATSGSDVLQKTLNVGGINVIDSPSAKYLFGGSLNITLCIILTGLGFVVGVSLAILELLMRPTLLNTKDMEDQFNLEVLGEVPTNDAYFRQTASLLVRNNSFLDITESFSSLAHIVNNRAGSRNEHQVIYITSASRGEGKTTAVANLAIQLSDMEKKVLLVDFDLRNPHLGSLFLKNVEYDHSLNALYRGNINESEAITTLSGYLDILPAVLERNAVPFDSTIFNMIRSLSEHYDYILIDTAPVGVAANTLSLNEIATSALFVVRFDTSSMQEIRESLERMDKSGVRMLGCIVNDVGVSENQRKNRKNARMEETKKAANTSGMMSVLDDDSRYNVNTAIGEDIRASMDEDAAQTQYSPILTRTSNNSTNSEENLFQMYSSAQSEQNSSANGQTTRNNEEPDFDIPKETRRDSGAPMEYDYYGGRNLSGNLSGYEDYYIGRESKESARGFYGFQTGSNRIVRDNEVQPFATNSQRYENGTGRANGLEEMNTGFAPANETTHDTPRTSQRISMRNAMTNGRKPRQ